jgi:hypothetical protein
MDVVKKRAASARKGKCQQENSNQKLYQQDGLGGNNTRSLAPFVAAGAHGCRIKKRETPHIAVFPGFVPQGQLFSFQNSQSTENLM